jgi:hypothetical protein
MLGGDQVRSRIDSFPDFLRLSINCVRDHGGGTLLAMRIAGRLVVVSGVCGWEGDVDAEIFAH